MDEDYGWGIDPFEIEGWGSPDDTGPGGEGIVPYGVRHRDDPEIKGKCRSCPRNSYKISVLTQVSEIKGGRALFLCALFHHFV